MKHEKKIMFYYCIWIQTDFYILIVCPGSSINLVVLLVLGGIFRSFYSCVHNHVNTFNPALPVLV